MRRLLCVLWTGLVCTAMGCEDRTATAKPQISDGAAPASAEDAVARGEYLVAIVGCGDCHTPFKMGEHGPEPDLSRFLAGHPQEMTMPPAAPIEGPWIGYLSATNTAFAGPWGVTYAANLTPDETTGMKIWTQAMFLTAMKEGKHMGTSRPIMPPMPWHAYRNMTDDDLKAIYAYLRTIPPVRNEVPPYEEPNIPGISDY